MHNTKVCMCYTKDEPQEGRRDAQTLKASKQKARDELSQLIHAETKKALCSALKRANHYRKHCNCHKESNSNSDSNYWRVTADSTGNLHVVKETKTSKSLVDTVSCPIKAIPSKNSNEAVDSPEDIGVTALVAIMEPATENLFSRVHKSH